MPCPFGGSMYRGNGFTATIEKVEKIFILTLRDRRGHLVRRRHYLTHGEATDDMMRYLGAGRAA